MLIDRAQGCLMGQLTGDALGSMVEFMTPREIRRRYPDGIRVMADGGQWDILAGQPTDDSEMALALARMLVEQGKYDPECALGAYLSWFESNPFDCGGTISSALRGKPNTHSQANGAIMRISPLGIFAAGYPLDQVAEWAMQEAELTHPNPLCLEANALFTMAIAYAVDSGCSAVALYGNIRQWALDMETEPGLLEAVLKAEQSAPADYLSQAGWVLIAFHNALWQLLHAPNFEEGLVDTVMRGGDTDTNAAICGALMGSVYGLKSIPKQWVTRVLNCRPQEGLPGVKKPRPECYWPVDALELAEKLVHNHIEYKR